MRITPQELAETLKNINDALTAEDDYAWYYSELSGISHSLETICSRLPEGSEAAKIGEEFRELVDALCNGLCRE